MKTARDVTYQLVRESGLTTILGEAVGAPVWAAPTCECAPFPEDSPAPAASLSRRGELEGEALMGSRTTNPTTDEVREEWKIPLVAERARIVRRAGEILRATREDRDDEGVDFGRYRIFPKLRLLLRDGVKVDIRARAFDVLWVLVQADGELVSKDQLLDTVWSGVVVEENNLQAQMSALRRALGADRGMIRTEFGLGYRLVVEKPTTPRSKAGTSEVKRSTPSSLPLPSTSSLRGADHREIERAFDKSRLVNIPGAGGGGKQRIALELGRRLAEHFQDGVDLAAMAKISEAELVGPALAGGPPIPSPHIEHADPIDSVLSGRQLLLIVDNCEHRDGASKTDEGVRTPPISDLPGNRREQEDADSTDYAGKVGDLRVKMIICVELQRENGRKARMIESAPNERQPWISAARPALAESD